MKYFAILQAAGAARNIETNFKPFKVDVHTKAISKTVVHDQCDQENFTFFAEFKAISEYVGDFMMMTVLYSW